MYKLEEEIDIEGERAGYSRAAEVEEIVDKEPEPVKTKPKRKKAAKKPRKTKAQLQQELKELKDQLKEKDKNLQSIQSARAYTVTMGTDDTVPIAELRAIAYLFPEFPATPTQRQLGETIRPQYIAALSRLKMLADI